MSVKWEKSAVRPSLSQKKVNGAVWGSNLRHPKSNNSPKTLRGFEPASSEKQQFSKKHRGGSNLRHPKATILQKTPREFEPASSEK